MNLLHRFYPESRFGGWSDRDGTVAFYGRGQGSLRNRLGYVGLAASLVPNKRHAGVLGKVQQDRKEIDVFPTRYRVNTVWRLRAELKKVGFDAVVYGYEAEPSYLQFSSVAYGFGKLLHSLTPPPLRTCLFAFGRKVGPATK